MHDKLKNIEKQSFLEILFASIEANFKKPQTDTQKCKKLVSKYKLINPINKNGKLHNFATGIYENGGKKYFIKTWNKKSKDLSYYSAINEFRVSSILFDKFKNISNKVYVPEPIEIVKSKDGSFSYIYEFIEGKALSKLKADEHKTYFNKVLKTIKKVSASLSEEEKKYFNNRGMYFYLSSLPILALLAVCKSPSDLHIITKACINFLKKVKDVDHTFSLAHRDIHTDNIKVARNKIYLLDSEDVVWTFSGFDESDLNIFYKYKLKDKNGFSAKIENSKFLEIYIAIHRSGNNLREDYYRQYLISNYG